MFIERGVSCLYNRGISCLYDRGISCLYNRGFHVNIKKIRFIYKGDFMFIE